MKPAANNNTSTDSKTNTLDLEKSYTNEQAAKILKIQPQTLAIWRMKGCSPPYVRCGRKPIYLDDDLRSWMKTRRFDPETRPM